MWKKLCQYYQQNGFIATLIHSIAFPYHRLSRPLSLHLRQWWKFHRFIPGVDIRWDAQVSGAPYMQIGRNFRAGPHMWLEAVSQYPFTRGGGQHFHPQLIIGDDVVFSYSGHVGCTHFIKIGNNVLIGSKCFISDHQHGTYHGAHQDNPDIPPVERALTNDAEVIIGDNVWIGDNVVILPGVHIGDGSIIGANAVVTHDIPPNSIAVGSPARVIKQWNAHTQTWDNVTRK